MAWLLFEGLESWLLLPVPLLAIILLFADLRGLLLVERLEFAAYESWFY